MRRREFLAASGVALAARGHAAEGPKRVVLFMDARGTDWLAQRLAPGFVDGANLRIELHPVPRDPGERAAAAREIVRSRPDVIVSRYWGPMKALKEATSTIPIVCAGVGDPVAYGFAKSPSRPGMNITGLSYGKPQAAEIQLAVMRALLPKLRRVLILAQSDELDAELAERALLTIARSEGIQPEVARPEDASAVDRAFATYRSPETDAAFVQLWADSPVFVRALEVSLKQRIATFGAGGDEVDAGMLMAYWLEYADYLGRTATLVGKVLRGANPAEIPFDVPDRTHFAINRRTARAIGVQFPSEVLLRATRIVD